MRSILLVLCFGLLVGNFGCASSGSNEERRKQVAIEEVARMVPASKRLSTFAHYEVRDMKLTAEIAGDEAKRDYANRLESMLTAKISTTLDGWGSAPDATGGTLVIEPVLNNLRIVSTGARVWAGAWAGDSNIDMTLNLIEAESGDVIASPRVERSSSATAGAWSSGSTDQNLLDYIVDISVQYLIDNR